MKIEVVRCLSGILVCAVAFAAPEGDPIEAAPDSEGTAEPSESIESLLTKPAPKVKDRDIFGVPKADAKPDEEEKTGDVKRPTERTKDGKYLKLGFEYLEDYDYILPDPFAPNPPEVPEEQVPERILALNEEPIVIVGYMMPVEVNKEGKVLSFVLVRDQSLCCFGVPPAINQWIGVEAGESGPMKFYSDIPIAVYGNLDIGEEMEDGYVISLYRMKADRVLDIRDLMREESK